MNELLFLWILSICKLKTPANHSQAEHKPFRLYSVCEWFDRIYLHIDKTHKNKIHSYSKSRSDGSLNTVENHVIPDETTHNEPFHLHLHCLHCVFVCLDYQWVIELRFYDPVNSLGSYRASLFAIMDQSKFKDGKVNFRNTGVRVISGQNCSADV